MSTIGKFVTAFVAPAAKQFGFARNGQSFRRDDAHGNVVSLQVSKGRHNEFDGPNSAEFTVFERLSLPEGLSYIYDDAPVGPVERYGEVYGHLVTPPADVRYGTGRYDEYWIFRDSDDRERAGLVLAAILRDEVFPRLAALLDANSRSEPRLIELLPRAYTSGLGPFIVSTLSGMQGDPDQQQVKALIAESERRGNPALTAWLRGRLPSA